MFLKYVLKNQKESTACPMEGSIDKTSIDF